MLSFDYKRPTTLAEAVSELQNGGRVVSGASDLLALVKDHIETPKYLVNITEITELSKIALNGNTLTIGAAVKLTALANNADVKQAFPMIIEAAKSIASPQIRNVGTVGGNLCQRLRCWYFRNKRFECYRKGGKTYFAVTGRNNVHAILGGAGCFHVNSSDLAPALIALDAAAIIANKDGQRKIPLSDLYCNLLQDITKEVILNTNEMLVSVEVPLPPAGAKMTYKKVRERETFDFALVSVAMVIAPQYARVVLGGVASTPWRSSEAESALKNGVSEATAAKAGEDAVHWARPMENNQFIVELVQGLIKSTALSLNS